MSTTDQHPWGRVDEAGVVYVRTADGERVVGEYPDASADEALASAGFAGAEGAVCA